MKSLLAATDLSPRSDRAIERALALSDEFNAQLSIVHVVDAELPSAIGDRLKQEAEEAIDQRLKRLSESKKAKVSRRVILGNGYKDILLEAERCKADLVIMGAHREDNIADIFLGTMVERVIRRGNDPVLVARNEVNGPYRRVLVGIDFSIYSRRAVEFALKFVPNGEINLVHAFHVPFKRYIKSDSIPDEIAIRSEKRMESMLDDEMRAFLASLSAPPKTLHQVSLEGPVWDVISRQVDKLQPDLLVIGTHGRTGVAHALLGSVAEELLREPPCDVVAVKAW